MPTLLSRLLLLALLLPGALAAGHGPQPPLPLLGIRVGGVALTVEVADQRHEREHGLMQRTELPAGRGMLFVYPGEARRVFWMRDTPLPLDAGFIGADGRLQEIVALEPLSERPVTSQWPARYVLEVPRGWFADHRLGPGARVEKLP